MRALNRIASLLLCGLAIAGCQSLSGPALSPTPVQQAQVPPLPAGISRREPNLTRRLLNELSESPATATTQSSP